MSESFFTDYNTPKPEEKVRSTKTYVSGDAVDSLTTKKKFDFEKEKKNTVTSLNQLSMMKVEEHVFYKKYEEIQVDDSHPDFLRKSKALIWSPEDINDETKTVEEIQNLQPKVKLVRSDEDEDTWRTLRIYSHSAEFEQAPGRFLKFLMVDKVTEKVLGFTSIASDVIAMSCRDDYIGWTKEDREVHKMAKYSAIATTIASTQPFGVNFFGAKLIAAMVTSKVVRDAWEFQDYGEAVACKLVGMTTTSLYGRPSIYDGVRLWWKNVGESKGKVPLKPVEKSYKNFHDWLKENHKEEYDEAMTQKEGVSGPVTGAKMRVLAMLFKYYGLKQSDYQHGYQRGVYYSCVYENTKEFLCRKINEDKLVMKQLFKDDTNAIVGWWKPKAIERYKKLKTDNKLNAEKLFYSSMKGMEYEAAKAVFFKDVGR